jgi:hypothetical protein
VHPSSLVHSHEKRGVEWYCSNEPFFLIHHFSNIMSGDKILSIYLEFGTFRRSFWEQINFNMKLEKFETISSEFCVWRIERIYFCSFSILSSILDKCDNERMYFHADVPLHAEIFTIKLWNHSERLFSVLSFFPWKVTRKGVDRIRGAT